jgi:hypothetical protein
MWSLLKAADQKKYIMTARTSPDGNSCGIEPGFAFSLLSAFALEQNDVIRHRLIMLRNPKGEASKSYNKAWSSEDRMNWSKSFIAQVPYGIDPLTSREQGFFFIEAEDLYECFENVQVAH